MCAGITPSERIQYAGLNSAEELVLVYLDANAMSNCK